MRQRRLKVHPDRPLGFYHCLSRIVDRRFIFNDLEKERFVFLMRELEAFCEVDILTYSVMSNHFHILLEVPHRPKVLPSADQILAKLSRLTSHQDLGAARQELERIREEGRGNGTNGTNGTNEGKGKVTAAAPAISEAEAAFLEKYYARMWDVSAFMKLLKQRFTQWYNGRTGRQGTLWEDRFRSVVVDGAGMALTTMAAYIDLNAVRAGLVKDPKDYRWCGYGEAVAGKKRARLGLQKVVQALQRGQEETVSKSLAIYRMHLFSEGSETRESLKEDGTLARPALSREAVLEVLKKKGKLGARDYVQCRVRYFCDGAVFGSREFVEEMFVQHRERFGKKRKDGARRMRGVTEELYTLRDLRLGVFG